MPTHQPPRNGFRIGVSSPEASDTRVTLPLALLVGAIVGGAWLLFTLWRQDIHNVEQALVSHGATSGHPEMIDRVAGIESKIVALDMRLDMQKAALIELHQALLSAQEDMRARALRRDEDWETLLEVRGNVLARLQMLEDALAVLHPRREPGAVTTTQHGK